MKRDLDDAKLFMCLSTAWDLMLNGGAEQTRREKRTDVESLRSGVKASCNAVFPPELFRLLEEWVDGADVSVLMP